MNNRSVELILKDDWYKTATPNEMKIALMNAQLDAVRMVDSRFSRCIGTISEDIFNESIRGGVDLSNESIRGSNE